MCLLNNIGSLSLFWISCLVSRRWSINKISKHRNISQPWRIIQEDGGGKIVPLMLEIILVELGLHIFHRNGIWRSITLIDHLSLSMLNLFNLLFPQRSSYLNIIRDSPCRETLFFYLNHFHHEEERDGQRDDDHQQRSQSHELGKHARAFLTTSTRYLV